MEKEFKGLRINGFAMLLTQFLTTALSVYILITTIPFILIGIIGIIPVLLLMLFISLGYVMVEPNDMRVLTFFGKYSGTIKENGFFWINPFYSKRKLTSRARNLDVEPIKVNDKAGNPVMIGLVLVWRVKDSYKSVFEIDSSSGSTLNGHSLDARMSVFQRFVAIQSDSALRNIASEYAYDNNEIHEEHFVPVARKSPTV